MGKSDLKISQLSVATTLSGNEIVPFAMNTTNGAAKVSLLKTFITDGFAKQSSVDAKQDKLKAGSNISISASNEISASIDLSAYLKSADAATTYAKKTEIPNVSGFATNATVAELAEQITALQATVADLQAKVDELTASTAPSE